jgi:hypothetical protein
MPGVRRHDVEDEAVSERWGGWSFTDHAIERMESYGLDHATTLAILENPDVNRPAKRGRRVASATVGERTLGVIYEKRKVVTIIEYDGG